MADKNLRVSIMLQMAEKVLGPLKNISQGSNETAQTLKAAREQLKLLEATQKDVGAFREIRTGLGETEAKLKVARDQVKQMSMQLGQVGVPTKEMAAAMAAARLPRASGDRPTTLAAFAPMALVAPCERG